MFFAGIDAHLSYVQIAVLDRFGEMALESRISTTEPERLLEALAPFRPLEAVVETCPFWPWITISSSRLESASILPTPKNSEASPQRRRRMMPLTPSCWRGCSSRD